MTAPITDDQRRLIARLLGEGLTMRATAEQVGCSARTVSRIRDRIREADPPPEPVSDDELALEVRAGLVSWVRRCAPLIEKTLAVYSTAVCEGLAGDARNTAVAFGVMVDKQLAMVNSAKSIAPTAGAIRVRPCSTIRTDEDARNQLH